MLAYPHIGTTAGAYYINIYPVAESSGWSNTQTLTIGDGNVATTQPTNSPTVTPTYSASESLTASPQQPATQDDVLFGLGFWQIATFTLLVVVVLLVFVVFYLRRRSAAGSVK